MSYSTWNRETEEWLCLSSGLTRTGWTLLNCVEQTSAVLPIMGGDRTRLLCRSPPLHDRTAPHTSQPPEEMSNSVERAWNCATGGGKWPAGVVCSHLPLWPVKHACTHRDTLVWRGDFWPSWTAWFELYFPVRTWKSFIKFTETLLVLIVLI